MRENVRSNKKITNRINAPVLLFRSGVWPVQNFLPDVNIKEVLLKIFPFKFLSYTIVLLSLPFIASGSHYLIGGTHLNV